MQADRATVQERSVLTCPACAFQQEAEMPTHACLFSMTAKDAELCSSREPVIAVCSVRMEA